MSQSVIVLSKIASFTRRVSPKGKPYWMALCDMTLDPTTGQASRTPVVIGASPAQIAKGVTESELRACGFVETTDAGGKVTATVLENAIVTPESVEGNEVSIRWEDPSEANPNGSWRIVTAQNAPEDAFRAALAAQKPGAPAAKPAFARK